MEETIKLHQLKDSATKHKHVPNKHIQTYEISQLYQQLVAGMTTY